MKIILSIPLLVHTAAIRAQSSMPISACPVCVDGFDAAYANFEIPASGGMMCSDLEAASAITPFDSEDCMSLMGAQGFCCPKCFMCGSAGADAVMASPNEIMGTSQPLTCLEMAHIYHMLSYPSASNCPADPADLDTSWHPTIPGVAIGFNLSKCLLPCFV